MADSHTVVTRTGLFGNIGRSFGGVIFGLVLFIAAFPVLFINEWHAVSLRGALTAAEAETVEVAIEPIDQANDNRLVHIVGRAETERTLGDIKFNLSFADTLILIREAEMYQWKETKRTRTVDETGGGSRTETTYSYSREWSSSLIDSSRFNRRQGHENPRDMPIQGASFKVDDARVGAFRLNDDVLSEFTGEASAAQIPGDYSPPAQFRKEGGYLYTGFGNPSSPEVGDIRVSFRRLPELDVSVIGQQAAGAIGTYRGYQGHDLLLAEPGRLGVAQMFEIAHGELNMFMWVIRFVGFFMMLVGIRLLFSPLQAVANLLPIAGRMVGGVGWLVAFAIALPVSMITILISWFTVRPLLSIGLIVLALVISGGIWKIIPKGEGDEVATPPPPPPSTGAPPPPLPS